MTIRLSGAQLIVQLLERARVELVAGIPGGALLPLYEALDGATRLRHVLTRHEQGAGFVAQGIARISGRAGVCLATSGPGATNLVTAIADAKLDSVPLVCITGQVPQALMGTDAFQEVKTGRIVDTITKANFIARSAAELIDLLPEAFRIAETGRPGPVLLDVPKDVQREVIEVDLHKLPRRIEPVAIAPDMEAIRVAAEMIARARRPLLYIGGGVVKSRGAYAARALAEAGDLPTASTLMALGSLPAGHPLNLGMLGMHGAQATNRAIDECDLLIAVGARFDDRATGRADTFAPNARVIHIDADRREFGKIRRPSLAIEADARLALEALARALPAHSRPQWRQRIAELRAAYPASQEAADETRTPFAVIRAVAELAGPNAAVTTDVGQHQMWVAQAYPFMRPDRWLTSGGLGTMGFGLPAAIGAALALPEDPVVCFTGDGSLLMNIQELATLAELQCNLKIVLLDNAALGMVRQQQSLFHRRRYVGSSFERPTDFCAVARAFGIPALDLGAASEPMRILAEAFAAPGPALIRVPISADRQVMPMVAPGRSNIEVIAS
ncbi:MAG: acetolactate synthase catalytic subunit [Hydrocarboniphaga sp.]|uniref:biosynthetic-type acetolactate synthase large subunit n=1 Tax=Hydrocarboniphaga sp. TaxID=2033016 RepID=UPI002609C2E8|nr:biosynthetic-type acetolactate synthase large subunit [Hydrocarboniphaga sp.]MDB5970907.1 acetolactate synthase catalytic subunit [Hydrocarboniphaga sp.]